MMKSGAISPLLLKKIDELNRPLYPFLQEEDEVYFLGEYTPGAQSAHSEMNQLILNYKKSVSKRGLPEYFYKQGAIKKAAKLFRDSIFNTVDLSDRVIHATLVPTPPSFHKDSQEYDDRNYQMLKSFILKGDIRELYSQKETRTPLHEFKGFRDPRYLLANYTNPQK